MRLGFGVAVFIGGLMISFSLVERTTSAGQPSTVEFARDIQPIFQQNCVGCHGPTQQMNGLRLDRRSAALRGSLIGAVIGPGNSAGSRLYLRVAGNAVGPQMPPTGALKPEQIEAIKHWIDRGAEWPDALANESDPAPLDPGAVRIVEAIRLGDRDALRAALDAHAAALNGRGPGGATPLMWAALDGDASSMRHLLARGADPKVANDSGVTALTWAMPDLEKVRLLVERGADVNAKSQDGRTPLMVAAGIAGAADVVRLLLDQGASPNEAASSLFGPVTALTEAAYAEDEATMRLLLARGADPARAGPFALAFALRGTCAPCVDLLLERTPPPLLSVAATLAGPPLGDGRAIKRLVDRGADVSAREPGGRTLLMLAAASDAIPLESVNALLSKGADLHATTPAGDSALALAAMRGETPIVEALRKAGAKDSRKAAPGPSPSPAASPRAAVERSLPMLQRTDETFLRKSGCVSCHNNTLTAMTVSLARARGLAVNEPTARAQRDRIGAFLDSWRERALQNIGIPGDADTISYILLGLAAENYPGDAGTEAMARFLLRRQAGDGRWAILAHRPPIESSDIQVTAASLRAIQLYAPKAQRAVFDRGVQRAGDWLAAARPSTTEDRAFQLLGLTWTGRTDRAIRAAARGLVAEQKPDGGWSQLPSLPSDAYATGQALYALAESGALGANDPAYARGVRFLVANQLADGSWFVKSRVIPIQPHFESDFPHGRDQFISAAATNWATMALVRGMAQP